METPKANPQPRIRLTEARNERKLSQQQVADRIGTTHVNVSRWERGITRPSPYFRRKLSQLFGKTEEELDLVLPAPPVSSNSSGPPINSSSSLAPTLPDILSAPAAPPIPANAPMYDPTIPLPPTVPLVGREQALSNLKQRLCSGKNVLLTILHGLPGVGKTTLSSTLAHDPEIRAYFSDGILWAGLGPEANTSNILSHWGSLLGISSTEMGDLNDREAWAVAIRRTIGSRRMLLIIDDAWSLKDVRTFRVGGANCAHLITTRYPSIASQAGTDGALSISELNEDESMQLLRLLAPRVVEREEQKTRDLVHAVGGLPLALNLIGNYLRMHLYTGQERRIDAALARLSDAEERLHIGEPHGLVDRHTSLPLDTPISLKSIIAVSDRHLSPQASAALHALSVFPAKPNSFSEEAALAVADCTTETLDELLDTGLLENSGTNRYTLHQTIADYARSYLENDVPYERLITYVIDLVEAHKKEYEILEKEETSILAALEAAHTLGKGAELMRCVYAFIPYLRSRGLYAVAEQHLQRAYNAAKALYDHFGLTGALLYLGEIAQKLGNYEQADARLQEGLALARQLGDKERIAALLADLGWVTWKRGEYTRAEVYLQEGLTLAQQIENKEDITDILETLGSVAASRGDYDKSKVYMEEALPLAREIGDREQICTLFINLGVTVGEQGNLVQAEEYFREGLVLARQLGHREWISLLLINLGEASDAQGHSSAAESYFQEGLIFAREMQRREWISVLLTNLGLTTRKQENFIQADEYLLEGLILARQIGVPQMIANALYEYGNLYLNQQSPSEAENIFNEMLTIIPKGAQDLTALAWFGLAQVAFTKGNVNQALKFGGESISLLEAIGHRKAKEVRQWLDSIMD